jgi:hypothetical protein
MADIANTISISAAVHDAKDVIMASVDPSVEALELRLRRLEYALAGSTSGAQTFSGNVPQQAQVLTDKLSKLAQSNKSIPRILQFCRPTTDTAYLGDSEPSILEDPATPSESSSSLSHAEKLAVVTSSAGLINSTFTSLLSLRELPFPAEDVSAQLANQLPDVVNLELRVQQRREEIASLVGRSVSVLEAWHSLVEGWNECVAEWDERLREVERRVLRMEKREREEEY